jgi:cation:H+ antiporter
MNIWLQLAICAGVILYAGSLLSHHADIIAEKTGLSGNWVGLVLLATVTSLPELITGVSAVTLHDLPDMAVSGTLGSCMFNMMVIAALDTLSRSRPVSHMVHQGHILSAGFGVVLIGFAAVDILFSKNLPVLSYLNNVDPITLAYPVIYLIAMRLIYSYERQRVQESIAEIVEATKSEKQTLSRSILIFVLNSLLIVAVACYLPTVGEQIAKTTGWGESFIGSSFIAITTSLPEIAVSVTAARMKSFDMAMASLLGSNLFNVVILAVIDFCYLKGPVLRAVSQANTLTALTAMISMGIVVIGLTYKSDKKFLFVGGDAAAIFLVCLMANILLFVAH